MANISRVKSTNNESIPCAWISTGETDTVWSLGTAYDTLMLRYAHQICNLSRTVRDTTHTGHSETQNRAFRHRMSLSPPNGICQSSIETPAMTNIIIILQSGKTGSAWRNNSAWNSPETNKQVWLVLHMQQKSTDSLWRWKRGGFASDWTKLICTPFNQNNFLCCGGHDGRIHPHQKEHFSQHTGFSEHGSVWWCLHPLH